MPESETPLPEDVFAVFSGEINEQAVQPFLHNFTLATQRRVKRIHLLLPSEDGTIVHGIFLHNFLKNSGVELITYNAGSASSIAVLIYLAGSTRIASASAAFLIHKSTNTFTSPVNAETIDSLTAEVRNNDAKIEGVLRAYLTMPKARWRVHASRNLIISPRKLLSLDSCIRLMNGGLRREIQFISFDES